MTSYDVAMLVIAILSLIVNAVALFQNMKKWRKKKPARSVSSLGQAFKQATRGGRIAVAFLSLLNILARKAPKVKEKQTKKNAQGKKSRPLRSGNLARRLP